MDILRRFWVWPGTFFYVVMWACSPRAHLGPLQLAQIPPSVQRHAFVGGAANVQLRYIIVPYSQI